MSISYVSGALYSWPELGGAVGASRLQVEALAVRGWSRVTLDSDKPLAGEDALGAAGGFRYRFLARESNNHHLLAGEHSHLVPRVLDECGLLGRATSPRVDIPRLASELVRDPDDYSLAVLFARVEGFGRSLRTVAFYGSDLAEASLFRELLPRLAPYRVQLRDVRSGTESVSIGHRGEVAFAVRDERDLIGTDEALAFLSRKGVIEWGT